MVNCVRAMNHGLQRLETLPLSLRLLREIHAELMTGVRGGDKSPGEFRPRKTGSAAVAAHCAMPASYRRRRTN